MQRPASHHCLLVLVSLVGGAVARSACPAHQLGRDQLTSAWAEFLQSGLLELSPRPGRQLPLRPVLAEMEAMLDAHKDGVARSLLGRSYSALDQELEQGYPELAVTTGRLPGPAWENIADAYQLFQRLALAVEVVRDDLAHHHHHHHQQQQHVWARLGGLVSQLLTRLVTRLAGRGVTVPPPLTRAHLSPHIRFLRSSVREVSSTDGFIKYELTSFWARTTGLGWWGRHCT